MAIVIMLLALASEATFFWGTLTKRVNLMNDHLQIAVNTTDENVGTQIKIAR